VLDNVALAILDLHSTAGFIGGARSQALVAQVTNTVRVKTPSLGQLVRNLSGGTSRRSCLSKWFVRNCDVYIFDEPPAASTLARRSRSTASCRACRQGSRHHHGFLRADRVMNMSDRIAVVWNGRIVGQFARGEATDEQVMSYALGLPRAARPLRRHRRRTTGRSGRDEGRGQARAEELGILFAFVLVCAILAGCRRCS